MHFYANTLPGIQNDDAPLDTSTHTHTQTSTHNNKYKKNTLIYLKKIKQKHTPIHTHTTTMKFR